MLITDITAVVLVDVYLVGFTGLFQHRLILRLCCRKSFMSITDIFIFFSIRSNILCMNSTTKKLLNPTIKLSKYLNLYIFLKFGNINNHCVHVCAMCVLQPCEHNNATAAKDYNWSNRAIILAADYASNGIYNFIVPLRAHFQPRSSLKPIVLLLEAQ